MTHTKPIIVIIPGAYHRPSHYSNIIGRLESLGYTVLSVPLVACGDADVPPDASPADDAAALHAQLLPLLDAGREAVLVGHSYGSTVATASIRGQTKAERAARGLPGGVVGAVWVAGFAFPAPGRNLEGGEAEPPLRAHRVLSGDGLFVSVTEGAKAQFYGDLPPAVADAAFAALCKFQARKSMSVFPQFIESEITVPKMYLLCEKDQTVLPALQEKMARVGKFDKVVRLDSGHAPFLSVPGEMVEAIVGFCEEISGS